MIHLSYDDGLDWLEAGPYGTVLDRQGHDRWRGVSEDFGYFLDAPGGREVGFKVKDFSCFDADGAAVAEIFSGPRFAVPMLGLSDAPAGEAVLAAQAFLEGGSTLDRLYFNAAIEAHGREALMFWRAALQAGNQMAITAPATPCSISASTTPPTVTCEPTPSLSRATRGRGVTERARRLRSGNAVRRASAAGGRSN